MKSADASTEIFAKTVEGICAFFSLYKNNYRSASNSVFNEKSFVFVSADYQYGPGFPGLGLLNPWLDAAYLGHAWHLPHPALVKGKHR